MLRIFRNTSGFTLIELIVGMLIFSIGMTSILALLQSTINNSLYSRHEVVASNLLREQVELVKNVRNTNVRNFIPFDSAKFEWGATVFASWVYIVENNYNNTGTTIDQLSGNIMSSPVTLSGISLSPSGLEAQFAQARLYIDAKWRYTHDITSTGTFYASYVIITPLQFENNWTVKVEKDGKPQWYIIDARVIVDSRGYKEYDLKTIITDWKK